MDQATMDALEKWKAHRYRPTDLPFAEAVQSLTSRTPLIEARQSETRKTDWMLCRAGTSAPATFVFAGVFAEADPYYTGNFVPKGEPIPPGLDESRVAHHAGYKPAYSYAIETYHDKDIWELHTALDAYMATVPGFNARNVKRRQWQSGSTWHWRYYFRVPMFLTCESRGGRPPPPPGLHEWVVAAHQKSRNYRANPIRPSVCGLEGGRLQRIEDCVPNVLEYGDVVSLVFTLAFVEDRDDWGPVTTISHVVRVQHADKNVYKLTTALLPTDPPVDDTGLGIGTVVDPSQVEPSSDAAVQQESSTTATAPLHTSASGKEALLPRTAPGPVILLEADHGEARPQPSSSFDSTPSATLLNEHTESGSEMEVDDDAVGPGAVRVRGRDASNEDGGSSGSSASTLADVSAPAEDGPGMQKFPTKKRTRPSTTTEEDNERAGRQARTSLNPLARRGGKGMK